MPKFSNRSLERLATCHPDLQRLFREVIRHVDCSILVGHRDRAAQEAAVEAGHSQLGWPRSLHNREPSLAVDVAPWPIDWADLERFRAFGGFVLGVASQMGIPLRWGGDWDGDWSFRDQQLIDLPHFELQEEKE